MCCFTFPRPFSSKGGRSRASAFVLILWLVSLGPAARAVALPAKPICGTLSSYVGSGVVPRDLSGWQVSGLAAAAAIQIALIVLLIAIRRRQKRAESALRKNEAEARQAQRMARLGTWEWDRTRDVVMSSEVIRGPNGLDPNRPLTLEQFSRIFTAESSERFRKSVEDLVQTEASFEQELECRNGGTGVWLSVRGETLHSPDGGVARVIGTTQDITKRKQAEEQLRKSEEKFSKAFRQGPLAITLTDAKTHRYIEVNDHFEHLTGYRREELIGHSVLEMGIWPNSSKRVQIVDELMATGHVQDAEFQYRTKEGELRVAQASADLIEIGGQACVLGIAADITDRKRAEEALQESEKRFRLMADSAPVLMWLAGPDTRYTDFNKEWLTFTGRSLQQEAGEGWTRGVHPEDAQIRFERFNRAFDARQGFTGEYRLKRHDGQYRWMLERGVPRFLENGLFAGYIGCCIDVTEQKEAKAARLELSGRLIHAQEEERARIARELHDDINQRLALLANGLQELQLQTDEQSPSLSRERLQVLWQITNEITNDLHDLSHQLHPSKLHYLGLGAAVREVCHEFAKQHRYAVKCIVHELPNELDDRAAVGLFRTVQEALRNVAKHSHAQHVKVELTRQGATVRLIISDDGVGFDPEHARRGGLGLFSMKERLKFAGGEFRVQSRPGSGTQVEASIPIPAPFIRTA